MTMSAIRQLSPQNRASQFVAGMSPWGQNRNLQDIALTAVSDACSAPPSFQAAFESVDHRELGQKSGSCYNHARASLAMHRGMAVSSPAAQLLNASPSANGVAN